MTRRAPGGVRGRTVAAAVALLLSALAVAVPSTSGAYLAKVVNPTNTAAAAARFTCAKTFASAANSGNAYFEYELTGNAATANDSSSNANPGSFQTSGAHPTGTAGSTTACPNDTGAYFYATDGTSNWLQTTKSVGTTPTTFSLAIWFSTTKAGGYLIGLNGSQTSTSGGSFDRHIYVDTGGQLTFGTFSGGVQAIRSPAAYNDGKWHQAVATMSAATGMALWVDGAKVASNTGYTVSEANTGYWRIAFNPLNGWPNAPTNTYFQGGLRFAAAYRFVLSDSEIAAEYANGKPGP